MVKKTQRIMGKNPHFQPFHILTDFFHIYRTVFLNYICCDATLVFETCIKLGNVQCKSNFNRNEVLLLMIENIKTIQIGKFYKWEIICTKKLPELLLLYPFTTCLPCVHQINRKILSIINTDTTQMSLFNHSKTV